MASRPTHKIDATGEILGRLATKVANLLRGKDKPSFTPNLDCGDQVVVYNTDKITYTGRKAETKKYYRHTGYLGNLKTRKLGDMPMEVAFRDAVYGMLPGNKLRSHWMKRLKLYKNEVPGHKDK